MQTKTHTYKIVLTAMMMCLIMVSILFIRIPIPFTQGYVHLGDAAVFLAVLVLGWKYGALAAALGGMLGDIIGGFAAWAPWTFVIKGIMALILGLVIMTASRKKDITDKGFILTEIFGMVLSGVFMAASYYFAEGIMYGNWVTPMLGVPWNIGQFTAGMVLSVIIANALCRTPAKNYFSYKLPAHKTS